MNVLDSSAWIEYFRASSLASVFLPIVEDRKKLIVPSITIYEVHKSALLEKGEDEALEAKNLMLKGKVILLDPSLAVDASRLSIKHKLPMADAIIYATTLANAAEVWTTDAHFKGLPNVRFFEKA
jgi:toxin FitB